MKGRRPAPVSQPATRVVISHTLDLARRFTALTGMDLPRTLVFLSIGWANVRDATLARPAASATDSTLQLDMRQPVSAYVLARMLDLPYETVRRAVEVLRAKGLVTRAEAGLTIPPSRQSPDVITEQARLGWNAAIDLLSQLGSSGVPLPAPQSEPAYDVQVRAARLAVAHFLASLGALRRALGVDVVTTFLFLAINRANFSGVLNIESGKIRSAGPAALLPDDQRQPISAFALARNFGTPHETVRRHIAKLIAAELCDRRPDGGIIVPARVLESDRLRRAGEAAAAILNEHLERLAEIGLSAPQAPVRWESPNGISEIRC